MRRSQTPEDGIPGGGGGESHDGCLFKSSTQTRPTMDIVTGTRGKRDAYLNSLFSSMTCTPCSYAVLSLLPLPIEAKWPLVAMTRHAICAATVNQSWCVDSVLVDESGRVVFFGGGLGRQPGRLLEQRQMRRAWRKWKVGTNR